MKLNKLTVKNFRTLEAVDIGFSGYYTAISGQNNAGKTSLIRAIRQTFKDHSREQFTFQSADEFTYRHDKTQWVPGEPDVTFQYEMSVAKTSDPGLFQFVEKFSEKSIPSEELTLSIELNLNSKNEEICLFHVDGAELSAYSSKELLQKIRSSNLAFVHDSAARDHAIFYGRGKYLHELMFSGDERKQIFEEQKKLQNKVAKISRSHKSELSELLGHLEDKYEVDFAIPDGMFTGALPFEISLRDKNVDVPLDDWGSGTRNRTHIMMSILQANRIRTKNDENRITPFVIIEEPESFLHPSAQAEFGRVLRDLANELQIQTIVTTHSPYMLCQQNVNSNVLLERKQHRGKFKATERVSIDESTWMEPFSKILGLDNSEFKAWKDVLANTNNCVLLVEGEIDKKYLEHIQSLKIPKFSLPKGIEIVAYEGKDALKNSILLKFIIEKFKKVFITFDLDARTEIDKTMTQLGLKEGVDFMAIGATKAGKQCIEGLIPERVLSKVYSENPDLVMQLTAPDGKDRKSAKSALKQRILAAFKAETTIGTEDLKGFAQLFSNVTARLG